MGSHLADNPRLLAERYDQLKKKYNRDAKWYTEYPHKHFWSESFGEEDLKDALRNFFLTRNAPTLLYFHMPFCNKQCYFCTCHTEISPDYEDILKYMKSAHMEIALYRKFFGAHAIRPNIREVHFGGGTPSNLKEKDFGELKNALGSFIDFGQVEEFAMEIDPRYVKPDKLHFFADCGLNRVSFGIQDFNDKVMVAVNRRQPAKIIENLLTPDVRVRFQSINFDILCGLPFQTRETFKATIEKVIELLPDRIALYFTSKPNVKFSPHWLKMPQDVIPNEIDKKIMFVDALEMLLTAGYVRTGYDMFARATDKVAKALDTGQTTWNSFGSTPGRCMDYLALGVHSYGRLGPAIYYQNVYELTHYEGLLAAGIFPVFRGHKLDKDDQIRRDVIVTLRVYFDIHFGTMENRYQINFRDYFQKELAILQEYANDELIEIKPDGIVITELGKQFANLICAVFDKYAKDRK